MLGSILQDSQGSTVPAGPSLSLAPALRPVEGRLSGLSRVQAAVTALAFPTAPIRPNLCAPTLGFGVARPGPWRATSRVGTPTAGRPRRRVRAGVLRAQGGPARGSGPLRANVGHRAGPYADPIPDPIHWGGGFPSSPRSPNFAHCPNHAGCRGGIPPDSLVAPGPGGAGGGLPSGLSSRDEALLR